MFLQHSWVITQKDTAEVNGAGRNILYFNQQGDEWFSNEAGMKNVVYY